MDTAQVKKLSEYLMLTPFKHYDRYKEYLATDEWRKRKSRYYDDNQRLPICACCGYEAYALHHVTYERFRNERDSDLVPLCNVCHSEVHFIASNTCLEVAHWFYRGVMSSVQERRLYAEYRLKPSYYGPKLRQFRLTEIYRGSLFYRNLILDTPKETSESNLIWGVSIRENKPKPKLITSGEPRLGMPRYYSMLSEKEVAVLQRLGMSQREIDELFFANVAEADDFIGTKLEEADIADYLDRSFLD